MPTIPLGLRGDKRWRGQSIIIVTLMLFVFIIAVISVCTVEIVAAININAITATALGFITLVHTVVDLSLFLNSKLKPVYAVAMSSIMFSFWLIFSVWEIVEMAFMGYDDHYIYPDGTYRCSLADIQYYQSKPSGDWSCPLPKARFSFSWILVFLYVASIVYSARALKQEKKDTFQRQVDQAVLAIQAIAPPILGCPQCGAQMLPHLTHQLYTGLPSPQYVQVNPDAATGDGEKAQVESARSYIFP
ncbi:hypothetical protein HOY80DRAFT_946501 [Tuber brumale]|nr:hypothetical protein HOY80DRAFT_946501 [Tuber brumale]